MEPWKDGTPDIPASAATFTTHASTRINAPAALVFRTLRNTETWRDWNRFVPRVTITFQPSDTDDVTQAEIGELVRNTSILGSIDSEITDGAAPGSKGSLTGRRMSVEEEDGYRHSPPPVTRDALRRASAVSGMSGMSEMSGLGAKLSGVGERPNSSSQQGSRRHTEANLSVPNGAGGEKLSAAQKFEAAQNSRRASLAAGEAPAEANNNVLIEAPHDPSVLVPAPPTATAKEAEAAQQTSRRPSAVSTAAAKRARSINAIYGEPSVRLQVGTKMVFHCRMKMPSSMALDTQTALVVTEVSRPDDDTEAAAGNLARTQTHTLGRSGVYRVVWSMQQAYSPPKSFPKFMLQAQRVMEIRMVKRGDGGTECELSDWECQRGVLAGKVKKRYAKYLEQRFEEWGRGLKGYAEAMGGAVERRDFVG